MSNSEDFDNQLYLSNDSDTESAVPFNPNNVKTTESNGIPAAKETDVRLRTEFPSVLEKIHPRNQSGALLGLRNEDYPIEEIAWEEQKLQIQTLLWSITERGHYFIEFCHEFGSEGIIDDVDEVLISISNAYVEVTSIATRLSDSLTTTRKSFIITGDLDKSFNNTMNNLSTLILETWNFIMKLDHSKESQIGLLRIAETMSGTISNINFLSEYLSKQNVSKLSVSKNDPVDTSNGEAEA